MGHCHILRSRSDGRHADDETDKAVARRWKKALKDSLDMRVVKENIQIVLSQVRGDGAISARVSTSRADYPGHGFRWYAPGYEA